MFPTFISILDIQSWWEVPSIAHFCSLFRTAFSLLDFDIEDLEEALLTDGTEEASWLQELIVRLLNGCLPNNEISTFNNQMFLRRVFREKCKEHDRYNPFNTDIDFQLLPLRTKVDILHALCDFRLDSDDVPEQLKNLEADSLRVEPLGYDRNESAYWYFYGTRLYREDFNAKCKKRGESVWQVVCFTEEDWFQLAKKFKSSSYKEERQLYRTLTENFLPELPRLFRERDKLTRKRLLENQPRRTSNRLKVSTQEEKIKEDLAEKEEEEKKRTSSAVSSNRIELETRRQESYERRAKLKEEIECGTVSVQSAERYEMAGNRKRDKKSQVRRRQNSNSSASSRDHGSGTTRSSNRVSNRGNGGNKDKTSTTVTRSTNPTLIGRQTNNSLASATGQIVIQPVANPHRKKLKTSQVFHQSDEDLLTGMHKILDYIKDHEDAWPFIDPVEEEYAPNYYTIIRKPMDLQRMEDRLDSGFYKTFSRFQVDFQLIVDNCRLYNGVDNEYTEMVSNLSKAFEKATKRYLDQTTSSDDEIAVEFPESEESKAAKRKGHEPSKRKPTLAAQTDKKRARSMSEESLNKGDLHDCEKVKNDKKFDKKLGTGETKNQKSVPVAKTAARPPGRPRKVQKTIAKVGRKPKLKTASPVRSRTRSLSNLSSSPPPSSIDSETDLPKKRSSDNKYNIKDEKKSKWHNREKVNFEIYRHKDTIFPEKPKDKNNKLRETIEKLKAKSEISSKLKHHFDDFDNEKTKENISHEINLKQSKRNELHKTKNKHKPKSKGELKAGAIDTNSMADSLKLNKSKKGNGNNNTTNNNMTNEPKNMVAIEALTLATEQTLKDINKWLDDMVSSASNSPSHHHDEFDTYGNKVEQEFRKQHEKLPPKKEPLTTGKDVKRRPGQQRDPSKFFKRREIQRTIDRLQPGKSKGNLLSNMQNTQKTEDNLFPIGLGLIAKAKDTKNALIIKTDASTPKLSLGSVLDSFGKHKFVDDKKEEEKETINSTTANVKEPPVVESIEKNEEPHVESASCKKETIDTKAEAVKEVSHVIEGGDSLGKATPNLSAWFKAFGAPKVNATQKKTETSSGEQKAAAKTDTKEPERVDAVKAKDGEQAKQQAAAAPPAPSPNQDSPAAAQAHTVPRQRRMSTGSTVSERSSFSQDMDSPRIGIDERLGAYPAPYPSPMHQSPSGVSPVLASPRPDVSPKATAYPTVNGQIRVGFYQDTVSTKSSPEKTSAACSPHDTPQSPYPPYSDHVYTPSTSTTATATTTNTYAYMNSPYYTHMANYANANAPPHAAYNADTSVVAPPTYYDHHASKPLAEHYPNKSSAFTSVSNGATYPNDPKLLVSQQQQQQQVVPTQPNPNYDAYRQQTVAKLPDKQTTMFPVKKRAYNEVEVQQMAPTALPQQQQQQQATDALYHHSSYDANHLTNLDAVAHAHDAKLKEVQYAQKQQQQQQHAKPLLREEYAKGAIVPNVAAAPQTKENNNNSALLHEASRLNAYANAQQDLYAGYNATETHAYLHGIGGERPLDLNARADAERKIDLSKYTNMGYTGPEMNRGGGGGGGGLDYARGDAYARQAQSNKVNAQSMHNEMMLRYPEAAVGAAPPLADYRNAEMAQKVVHASNVPTQQPPTMRGTDNNELLSYKGEVAVPRPPYPPPTNSLAMDQSLGLRGNLTTSHMTHIVDRYATENMYYGEKSLYAKPMATSSATIPMFNQPTMTYSHQEMQGAQAPPPMYNRQLTELQNAPSQPPQQQQQHQQQQPPPSQPSAPLPVVPEKKGKRRKNAKTATAAAAAAATAMEPPATNQSNQGFQSYAGLKDSSAISLKTASVVPGSAFNFGPTPTGLGLAPALYGDKDAYPNLFDEYRSAPNYYMAAAAAAAHHRTTPEGADKQVRAAHQPPVTAAASYPFIGAPQPRPSYPFMPPHQAGSLMDPSSPLYQQYLQAGVLHQGLLGAPGTYPPSYLSMRQPFDSMTRPSWL